MKALARIVIAPILIFALTAFGMTATCLAKRNPSPPATIGVAIDSSAAFGGEPLRN